MTALGLLSGAPGTALAEARSAAPSAATAEPPAGSIPYAVQQAKSQGEPVPVTSLTTPTGDTVANPNGSLSTTTHLKPVRVLKSGKWTELDPTLQLNPDGTYSPQATPTQVTLSGGGTGPLATLKHHEGRSLELSFPVALPAPKITGDSALYPDVFPGVDLQASVNDQGAFSEVLIVRTAQAAANPALHSLRLATKAEGLTLGSDSAGNLQAAAPDGTPAYTSATPLMWDSSTSGQKATPSFTNLLVNRSTATEDGSGPTGPLPTELTTPSSTDSPGPGAQVKTIGISTQPDAVTLTPDQELLTGEKTTYPVYIDPMVNPVTSGTGHFVVAQEGCSNATTYDKAQDYGQGVGYQQYSSNCFGMQESFYEINTSALTPQMVVQKSTLYLTATYAADHGCSNTWPVTVKQTNPISSGTNWNNRPGVVSTVGTQQISSAYFDCGYKYAAFDITDRIRQVASHDADTWTFGLYGDGNKVRSNLGFMRFASNPYITTVFDIPPTAPDSVSTTPDSANPGGAACNGGTPGWIGRTSTTGGMSNISLNARLTTPMEGANLQAIYTVWDNMKNNGSGGAATVSQPRSPFVASGTTARTNIGITVADGHQYGWGVKAYDGTLEGPWTSDCNFKVDLTPPTAAAFGDSKAYPPLGSGRTPTAHAGDTGITIPVSSKDILPTGCDLMACLKSEIRRFEYALDAPIPVSGAQSVAVTADANGAATTNIPISLTAQQWGTHALYVRAVDGAGNSRPAAYSFYAPWNPATPVTAGDLTGDGIPDILRPDRTGSGNLLLSPGNTDVSAPAITSSTAAQSPDKTGWDNYLVTHRGSLSQSGVDDVFTYNRTTRKMYVYGNDASSNGTPGRFTLTENVTPVATKPTCNPAAQCTGYVTDWSKVTQILAPGSFANASGLADLVTVEDNRLWYYPGSSMGNTRLGQGMLLGSGDWSRTTLIAPGKVGGTPTLWARDEVTGRVHSYTLSFNAGYVPTAVLTPPSAQAPASALTTIDPKLYPQVGSYGDLNGDGRADIWAIDTNQQLVAFTGTSTGFSTTPVSLGNLNKPSAQWKLTGQNGTATPSAVGDYPATASGITWPTASIQGRDTAYAAFTSPQSTITTTGPVIDTRKSFTISTWAKPGTKTSIIASQDGNRSSSFFLYADTNTGKWHFALAYADVDGWPFDYTAATNDAARFTPNTWTRLTASYNADSGLMSLYVNGVLAGSAHHQASSSPAPSGPFVLGRSKNNGGPWDSLEGGGISNLAVYPYAASLTTPGALSEISMPAAPGTCMDNDYASTQDGNKIQIAGCNGTPAQSFEVRGDGSLRIQGKCVNAANDSTANLTLLQLMTCRDGSPSPAQKFIPFADGVLYNPASGRCVDLGNLNTTPATQLWLYDCNPSGAQRWSIPALATTPLPNPTP
ncbi:LamG-like jellyroll fold domain-containing protein [Streptomyces sp. ISL-94]|uniref:LamG-like jellyroll fold domain-containing protein n=1 Tax=Streptomyces sp. ISL-94 TaxID=2819190 RepID=UPI001BE6E93A|nr:LamG-like jellyroll fold domain-containing protein [Streptomyces sp. ISL-94]MBT2478130.1 ricin-type beta-trefoil lectin domain protein [Streptomyces sp. ISL-94]